VSQTQNRPQQGFAPTQNVPRQFEPQIPQKSNLELMMEQFMNQQKQAMDEMKETIKQQST
jgi:hypothetical protein